ncbi:ribulose-phosphate 3-epimerase [Anaerosphaera multitolerans]|uniref:Ribulose-phosphate 3-epimerase n=1 Tax=Anaerosphaera multitolerans TaxID=2487351 RepID=A0A437S6W2_9FIRM|nr:ribulose-phosphate 3-epimerase [Anaerosphaera multitolerans]RVU54756.1 ribulose-phosphate 3-epimerase [Anaerosphaera multitolerans]
MISPSILSADFTNIRRDFDIMNETKVDFVHVDIMDGNYVPNISFGPGIVSQLRKLTSIDFDVHLMIEKPENYIEDFVKAGANLITVHPNSTTHLNRTLNLIKSFGIKAGIVINPAENLDILKYTLSDINLLLIMSVNPGFGGQSFISSSLKKIREAREIIDNSGYNCLIEADGGIKLDNALEVYNAGADILVVGSAIFGKEDPTSEILKFKELLK